MALAARLAVLAVIAGSTAAQNPDPPGPDEPSMLRTEHHTASEVTLAVPTEGVRFTWQNLHSNFSKGAAQSHFQLQVLQNTTANIGNATNKGEVVHDSGAVASAAQYYRLPASVTLKPGTDYAWRVQTVVGGKTSTFSTPLHFTTAPTSWGSAQWIGGKNQLRSSFALPAGKPRVDGGWEGRPTRARAYVSGLGAFYLYMNGEKVGDHILDPPQTVYPKRVNYVVFDVLTMLLPGENVIGSMLGNYKWGYTDVWCNMTAAGGPDGCRAFLFKLELTMEDGSIVEHTSNTADWKCRQSPVVWDHLFHGETYDARLEIEDWASPKGVLDPTKWQPTVAMDDIPGPTQEGAINTTGPLVPTMMPPIRVTESFPAIAVGRAGAGAGAGSSVMPVNCAPKNKLAFRVDECELARLDSNCNHPDPPCCDERTVATLKCKSGTIKDITFAAYGSITGTCDAGFQASGCHADIAATLGIIKEACVGKSECSFNATMAMAGPKGSDPCPGHMKALAVEATGCEAAMPPHAPPPPPPPPPMDQPTRWVFDFGQNVNGFVTLSIPAGHGLPAGTKIQLEHGEITHAVGGDTFDTYCRAPSQKAADLRHEPCGHQTYGVGHETDYEYIGDFNCANMTNIYITKDDKSEVSCTNVIYQSLACISILLTGRADRSFTRPTLRLPASVTSQSPDFRTHSARHSLC